VLFIDELPILVMRLLKGGHDDVVAEGIAAAEMLMSWLRAKSLEHNEQLRLVITGSIGLEPVLERAGLSATINHLTPLNLEPWDEPTALGCLFALASQYQLHLEEDAARTMARLLGCCIPHHVQMFFAHVLRDANRRASASISQEDVERVYHGSMLSNRGHAELSHLEERLKQIVGLKLLPLTLDLLTEAATTGELTDTAVQILVQDQEEPVVRGQLHEILRILEHDGYLTRKDEAYIFVSDLVRDWWKARFGFGYVPTNQRPE
jgi:hypothetical protein